MKSIEVRITETARPSLGEKPYFMNALSERFDTIEEVERFLTERYGKLPKGRNKVYVENKDGSTEEVGFTHSFWNRDVSHDSKPWFQTDWIMIVDVVETPRLL